MMSLALLSQACLTLFASRFLLIYFNKRISADSKFSYAIMYFLNFENFNTANVLSQSIHSYYLLTLFLSNYIQPMKYFFVKYIFFQLTCPEPQHRRLAVCLSRHQQSDLSRPLWRGATVECVNMGPRIHNRVGTPFPILCLDLVMVYRTIERADDLKDHRDGRGCSKTRTEMLMTRTMPEAGAANIQYK